LDDPFLTSVVQHHEHGENKKFLGTNSATRPPRRRHCRHSPSALLPCPMHYRSGWTVWPFDLLSPLAS
jgi:hypothetical protein